MIVTYRNSRATKAPGYWYTFTYDNGIRATLAEYQGDVEDLEALGRRLAREKGREVRMQVHDGRTARIHRIFRARRGQTAASGRPFTAFRGDGMRFRRNADTVAADVAEFVSDADWYGWTDNADTGEPRGDSLARGADEIAGMLRMGRYDEVEGIVRSYADEDGDKRADSLIRDVEALRRSEGSRRRKAVSMSPKATGHVIKGVVGLSKAYVEEDGRVLRRDFRAGKVRWHAVPYTDEWQAFVEGRNGVYRLVVSGIGPYSVMIYAPIGMKRRDVFAMENSLDLGRVPAAIPEDAARIVADSLPDGDVVVRNIAAEDYYARCRGRRRRFGHACRGR